MLQQHFNYSLHESHFSCEDKTSQSDSNSPLLSILPHSIGFPSLDNFLVNHKGSIPSLSASITQNTSNTPITRYLFSAHHSTSQGSWIGILLVTDTLSPQSSGWGPISSSLWLLVHLLSCLERQTLPRSYYSLLIRATEYPVPKLFLTSYPSSKRMFIVENSTRWQTDDRLVKDLFVVDSFITDCLWIVC